MNRVWITGVAGLILSVLPGLAELKPLPMAGVTAISFSPDDEGKALVSDPGKPGHVELATIQGGRIGPGEDGKNFDWKVAAAERFRPDGSGIDWQGPPDSKPGGNQCGGFVRPRGGGLKVLPLAAAEVLEWRRRLGL